MSNLFGTLSKMRKTNKKTANGSSQFNGMISFFTKIKMTKRIFSFNSEIKYLSIFS
jgi:hypothetical protein